MAHVPKPEPLDARPPAKRERNRVVPPVGAADDRELVRRAQREDKEAFEELIRRH